MIVHIISHFRKKAIKKLHFFANFFENRIFEISNVRGVIAFADKRMCEPYLKKTLGDNRITIAENQSPSSGKSKPPAFSIILSKAASSIT